MVKDEKIEQERQVESEKETDREREQMSGGGNSIYPSLLFYSTRGLFHVSTLGT